MNASLFPRLAADSIRKNRRVVLPYIFTCSLMIAMFYILSYLSDSNITSKLSGGTTLGSITTFGSYTIAIFSVIFLYYTNSFIIRRRKKEFGLYNILGMGKRNLGRILFYETLIIALISMVCGLAAGIGLSKLAELGLSRIIKGNVSLEFSISIKSIGNALLFFAGIFLLIFIDSLRQVHFSQAVNLLRSENYGEKPPKANWVFGFLGVIILGAAYYIAVITKGSVEALLWFFVAVIMVIIATYLIFIASSVLLCKILQKNKKYYYKAQHFVSISSIVYRMKRNGAGLASICILLTMVLVMISSTTSLFIGMEDSLSARYPRDLCVDMIIETMPELRDENADSIYDCVEKIVKDNGVEPENILKYRSGYISGFVNDGHKLVWNRREFDVSDEMKIMTFFFIPLSDYNRLTGENRTLSSGEILVTDNYKYDTFVIEGETYSVKKDTEKIKTIDNCNANTDVNGSTMIVLPDFENDLAFMTDKFMEADYRALSLRIFYAFDFADTVSDAEENEYIDSIAGSLAKDAKIRSLRAYYYASLLLNRGDFYETYGGLFFLGIMLSIVFIIAAVLIIYYKQISEGYEDRSRFEIMQKVGMTDRDIRRNINSQMLTVFFLPLIFAGLHLAFAFPMVWTILQLFNLHDMTLMIIVTAGAYLVSGICYIIIYKMTAEAYFKIVSGAKKE